MAEWDFDDRRGWRYSTGGRPVELAWQMLRLLSGEQPAPEDLDDPLLHCHGREPDKSAVFQLDSEQDRLTWRQWHLGLLPVVRHPAPDIAYVFALRGHPDQTEPVLIEKTTKATAFIFTLVYDDEIHQWKIHSLGRPTPPDDLGKTPFSPASG